MLLTKNQRDVVSEFLLALIREIEPSMMMKLLLKLSRDVATLGPQSTVSLRILTDNYERCFKYYRSSSGMGSFGAASDEERKITSTLFSRIFDSLANTKYEPDLFNNALPCLSAIGASLPPDYSVSGAQETQQHAQKVNAVSLDENDFGWIPTPVDVTG